MKLLIPNFGSVCKEDFKETLERAGHEVIFYLKMPEDYENDPIYCSGLCSFIKEEAIDVVFSFNYYPVLSLVCQKIKMPYLSWCYDSPLVLLYSRTIFNSCNFIFIFDSQMVMELKKLGVDNVYYLPMAVNISRLDGLSANENAKKILDADVSFVGTMYNEKHNLYSRYEEKLDSYTRGYLEGIMQAQRRIYGYYFLEELLTEDVMDHVLQAVPLQVNADELQSREYVYANYFLCRKMTSMDRAEIFSMLDARKEWKIKLYTPNPTPQYTHVQNMGSVQYAEEMPLVFRHSRINLNITLRSIQNGIPLRAMDIMGAGGFLLSNYQNDFSMHFEEGRHYVCYDGIEDMMQKISYYLQHDKERQEIAGNAYEEIKAKHTYERRLEELLSVI